jgi:hypothetical protein
MNKLWKTRKHARTLIQMAFLCVLVDLAGESGQHTVKQPEGCGTSPHKSSGITNLFGGKARFSKRCFCVWNENRMIILSPGPSGREQTARCPVFNSKTVTKYLSRSRSA